MKVLDLQCASQHLFEGWFASEEEFQRQLVGALVECPLCGTTSVTKRLSAPRLNLVSGRSPLLRPDELAAVPMGEANLQAEWIRAMRHLVANTEDVGERFPEEARKMHYGETPERGIRGQATVAQSRELLDEGIPVLALPLLNAAKEPLH